MVYLETIISAFSKPKTKRIDEIVLDELILSEY
jgi:hypothetical protein